MVKNDNFTLLLISGSKEWQYHIATTSSGQELKFHIATDMQWSRLTILHNYHYLLNKNGNLTLLMKYGGQEWQFHIAADI